MRAEGEQMRASLANTALLHRCGYGIVTFMVEARFCSLTHVPFSCGSVYLLYRISGITISRTRIRQLTVIRKHVPPYRYVRIAPH